IMYADKITNSMRRAIDETERRRCLQIAYNQEHGITPESVKKAIYSMELESKNAEVDAMELMAGAGMPRQDLLALTRDLEKEMKRLSKELQFEDAAKVRDRIISLRKRLAGEAGVGEEDGEVALAAVASPVKAETIYRRSNRRRG
ncbi:MAG: UvrB/UvrC motif-containing protein, partial [Candidatus Dormibacteraceae bacterium]